MHIFPSYCAYVASMAREIYVSPEKHKLRNEQNRKCQMLSQTLDKQFLF